MSVCVCILWYIAVYMFETVQRTIHVDWFPIQNEIVSYVDKSILRA